MKKSIVKAKLPSKDIFIASLAEIDKEFSEPYWQHDRIFVPRSYDRNTSQPRLSLRTTVYGNDEPFYDLVLRRHFESRQLDIINITEIIDYSETAYILYQLGYELKYEVSRRRQELDMGEDIKIFVDKIDNVPGYYAKIESNLDDRDDPAEARADLIETFKVLGVNSSQIVSETYGELKDSIPPED